MIDGQLIWPWRTVYNEHGISRAGSTHASAELTCGDATAKVWVTQADFLPIFTQNTNMGTRYLWAGGAFFLAIMFAGAGFRERSPGKG